MTSLILSDYSSLKKRWKNGVPIGENRFGVLEDEDILEEEDIHEVESIYIQPPDGNQSDGNDDSGDEGDPDKLTKGILEV